MSASILRRALLYVPGSSLKMLEKSRSLSVDCVVYDLEDSVAPDRKDEARSNLRQIFQRSRPASIREQAVRINSIASGLALEDLSEVLKAPNVDVVVVPKVNSPSDLHCVADFLHIHSNGESKWSGTEEPRPPIKILALIESAKAIMDLSSICKSTSRLSGLIFAAEDFALDLSITRTPSLTEFLYARSAIVTACRAHDLPSSIDLVCTEYRGEEGRAALERECLGGKGLGFNGKQLIHPTQIETCQRAFSPSEEEITWAVRIMVANKKANDRGRGAFTLDGKMIDAPVVGKANDILRRAELCSIDTEGFLKAWSHQEPE